MIRVTRMLGIKLKKETVILIRDDLIILRMFISLPSFIYFLWIIHHYMFSYYY